jgi:ribosomal protein S12 methylthiotransferase
MAVQREISSARAAGFVGRTLPMLVEGSGETDDGDPVVAGRTYREAPEVDGMVIATGTGRPGAVVQVRITAAGDYDLFGEVA